MYFLFTKIVLDSLHKELVVAVLSLEKNDTLRENVLLDNVAIPGFLFTFLKLGFFLGDFFSIFIKFLWFVKENLLSLLVSSWETVKYVASIPAVILGQPNFEYLEEKFFRKADL
jgi:hypothetical protein